MKKHDPLAQAIARDELALGFLPLKYAVRHSERLKVLAIDNSDGRGPILPTRESIRAGTYQPLARPMFVYVRAQALNRPAVGDFVDFFLDRGGELLEQSGYIPLGNDAYELVAERRRARWTGTMFGEGGPQVGLTMPQLLDKGGAHLLRAGLPLVRIDGHRAEPAPGDEQGDTQQDARRARAQRASGRAGQGVGSAGRGRSGPAGQGWTTGQVRVRVMPGTP